MMLLAGGRQKHTCIARIFRGIHRGAGSQHLFEKRTFVKV